MSLCITWKIPVWHLANHKDCLMKYNLFTDVPVTTVKITPAGNNNVVDIVEGETQTCTCTTDFSRPASWIEWYNYFYLYYSTSDNSDNHSSW
jgi:hypothetical protein